MKDLIVGDLHLGSKLFSPEAILHRLRRVFEEVSPDRVFFLGDIFDSSLPDPRWVYQFLKNLHDVEWYAIDGNHDIHSGLFRSALMVFGYEYGEYRRIDNYVLVPWSFVLKTNIKTASKFWGVINVEDGDYVLTHFAIADYPKAKFLMDKELVLTCPQVGYLISGHIHEGMLFQGCEHTGSFVPVKINELTFDRWVVVIDGNELKSRIPIKWPHYIVEGTLDAVISNIEQLDFNESYGVIVINTADKAVLSYSFSIPDGWVLRVNYQPLLDKREVVAVTALSDDSRLLSLDEVMSSLIDKDSSGIPKEKLRDAWSEVKSFEAE